MSENTCTKIKPCPFCGSVSEVKSYFDTGVLFYVLCQSCYAQSGLHKSQEDAVASWNSRVEARGEDGAKGGS